jgi:hypothetical protein
MKRLWTLRLPWWACALIIVVAAIVSEAVEALIRWAL